MDGNFKPKIPLGPFLETLLGHRHQDAVQFLMGSISIGQKCSNSARQIKSDKSLSTVADSTHGAMKFGSKRMTSAIRSVFSMKSIAAFIKSSLCAIIFISYIFHAMKWISDTKLCSKKC